MLWVDNRVCGLRVRVFHLAGTVLRPLTVLWISDSRHPLPISQRVRPGRWPWVGRRQSGCSGSSGPNSHSHNRGTGTTRTPANSSGRDSRHFFEIKEISSDAPRASKAKPKRQGPARTGPLFVSFESYWVSQARRVSVVAQAVFIATPPIWAAGDDGLAPQPIAAAVIVGVAADEDITDEEATTEVIPVEVTVTEVIPVKALAALALDEPMTLAALALDEPVTLTLTVPCATTLAALARGETGTTMATHSGTGESTAASTMATSHHSAATTMATTAPSTMATAAAAAATADKRDGTVLGGADSGL
jgi:hypothetical protein